MAADQDAVVGQANRLRHGAGLHTLQWPGRESILFAIHELPAGRGEDAVVDEEQIAVGQLDEVGFGNGLAAEDGQGIRPGFALVMREEEHHFHIADDVELGRRANRIVGAFAPFRGPRATEHQRAVTQRAQPMRIPREAIADEARQLRPGLPFVARDLIDVARFGFRIARIRGPDEAVHIAVWRACLAERSAVGDDGIARDDVPCFHRVGRFEQHMLLKML